MPSPQLINLRAAMKERNIDAYIVPTDDDHQSEYIAPFWKRREFISGFTGSAGTAVILADDARLWTDGRYFLQASQQLDSSWTLMKDRLPETPSVGDWLKSILKSPSTVAFDPKLAPQSFLKSLDPLKAAGHNVVLPEENLVDLVWPDQPAQPCQPLAVHPDQFAGESVAHKLERIQASLKEQSADALVLSALDETAWTFNVRGSDIEYNPVVISYGIIPAEGPARLYVDPKKVTETAKAHLAAIDVRPYQQFFSDLKTLGQEKQKIWVDPGSSVAVFASLPAASLLEKESPVVLFKSLKNAVELEGFRLCHIRDAAAKVRYFAWLEEQLAAGKSVNECEGADRLESYRSEGQHFVSLSFDTISGAGPNGAIIHYKPEPQTCAKITKDHLYLCDSGAQYRDGTTDVTRTVHFGQPTPKEKDRFTRVLKGHIALGRAVFPPQASGRDLDVLARLPLWSVGLDFRHGTGHGVGSFLNVHEGPQGINRRTTISLQKGMTITNEPGYYEDGEFGIRIENVMFVVEAETPNRFGDITYLTFDNTVTLVPIMTKLVEPSLLTGEEMDWLDHFHAKARQELTPLLTAAEDARALAWLNRETQPLVRK